MANYKPGDTIRFTYMSYTPSSGKSAEYKYILVLANMHEGKVHGLDLGKMTEAQRDVIRSLFDPDFKLKKPLAIVENIKNNIDPVKEIRNPISFYQRFVKPFLQITGDVYRTYVPQKMSGVQIVEKADAYGKDEFGRPSHQRIAHTFTPPEDIGSGKFQKPQPGPVAGKKPTPFSSQSTNKGPLFKK